VARYGPPDDFNRQPTQYADSGTGGYQPSGPTPAPTEAPGPDPFEADDLEAEPTPWYRRPVTLIGWALLVVILIALIIYGIVELIGEGQRAGHTPAPTTTAPPTTTVAPSATETTTPPAPTTSEAPPATGGPSPQQPTGAPPAQQPTQSPTHHHLPPLPSTITIPGMPNPITLPPNLPH
jgi:hypothetical protein